MKIAIDGFSSTGKSSYAKLIARKYHLTYIDTGLLYRAITYANLMKSENIQLSIIRDGNSFGRILLNGKDIDSKLRSLEVSVNVSKYSVLPDVRRSVKDLLRTFSREGNVVMDGRDIGTVIMPDADIKIFMTASENVRAERRFQEMRSKGDFDITYEQVLSNLKVRDKDDVERELDPLRKADDAVVLDNSEMSLNEEMEWFDKLYRNKKRIKYDFNELNLRKVISY